jgi:hypothetical protein
MLRLSDTPHGWVSDLASAAEGGGPQCLSALLVRPPGETSRKQVLYRSTVGLPSVSETVRHFGTGAATQFRRRVAAYEHCGHTSYDFGGLRYDAVYRPLAFRRIDDDSAAFELNLSTVSAGRDLSWVLDFVEWRSGSLEGELLLETFTNADHPLLTLLTARAVTRLDSSVT